MKFYLAASFKRRDELNREARYLQQNGHQVTSRWHSQEHEADVTNDWELSPEGPALQFATNDLADIDEADAVLMFSSRERPAKGRGGRHAEFGYCLGTQKPVYIIGRREHAFHSMAPCYPDLKSCLEEIIALHKLQP